MHKVSSIEYSSSSENWRGGVSTPHTTDFAGCNF